ncbi:MAG TPA: DUF4386 domain-containing protein [Thermoanaerobaculia bacterium]
MNEIRLDGSPLKLARAEGVVYLLIILLGIFVELFVRGRIIAGGDAAATAANLTAMQSLWRVGIVAELLMVVCTVCSALFLYLLLKPVSRHLALLATFFGLTGLIVEAGYALYLVEALFPLLNAAAQKAFTAEQLQALTYLTLKTHGNGFGIALFLFGPAFLIRGWLVARSRYFPKVVGRLYQLAGVAYLVNSLVLLLAPQYAGRVFAAVAGPGFIGEVTFCLWLLIKGLNVDEWNEYPRT